MTKLEEKGQRRLGSFTEGLTVRTRNLRVAADY